MDASSPGYRIREARKRRGLTQRELADAAGLSLSAVKKIEQGTLESLRLETAHRMATALGVPTMTIVDPAPPEPRETEAADRDIWAVTRDALLLPSGTTGASELATTDEIVTERGTADVLLAAVKLYHDNEYDRLARVLPALLRDSRDASPLLRSRVMQLAGSVMTQTRQHDAARVALTQAMADAESTGSDLDSASTVITMCWLLIVEGQFERVRNLAAEWADRVEPRLSTATIPEISAWGWLLLRGSAAAIRDNRPGEASDMMRLAEAAAVAAGPESRGGYRMYWTTFGAATVAMKRTENALVNGKPDIALRLAARVPQGLRPTSDNRNRHLLDVSAARTELRQYDDAVDVLRRLQAESGPWLYEQRMARDVLGRIVKRRRTLTPDMRDLADAVRLPL
jgi:transcriptional regulator with XRE-family HTH domain